MSGDIRRAEAILRSACGERLRTDFSMAALTTFRIGGPAALYLEAESDRNLIAVAEAVAETGIDFVVLGKGSNILVSDEGFAGLVIRLGGGFRWVARTGDRLTAGAAMPLPALSGVALSHGLAGSEFGVAIPASLGGAVRMNAGAHGREMSEIVESIDIFSVSLASRSSILASEAAFTYRGSALPSDAIVVGASVLLRQGDAEQIRALMDEAREWRRRTQPLAEPNCGSVFKNPPGEHAARLIDEAGLKGSSLGGASVSMKHANFIVTSEGARASDVLGLIRNVQTAVATRSGIHLEPEVHLVGHFDLVTR